MKRIFTLAAFALLASATTAFAASPELLAHCAEACCEACTHACCEAIAAAACACGCC